MTSTQPILTRRALLGVAALAPLAACSGEKAPPAATSSASPSEAALEPAHERLAELEREFGARLGVYALDTGTGATVVNRPDERFAFCSTFKLLAAAALVGRHPMSYLDTVVAYTEADLLKHAPVTSKNLAGGMTVGALCDAAVRYSDGTAGNLLLRELGGPAELTAFTRGLGDNVTRMDRIEPDLTEATPGDPRDTSSPRALGGDFRRIALGEALPAEPRAYLRDLLERNRTGDARIRAGVPPEWTIADKTGTGDYGTLNDIALAWRPHAAPLVIAIMSSKDARDAEYDEALLAETAAYVADTLG
ncbi:class A beta-lactamase [Phytomonospora sp. NPDC050363]|uniref:class A beta-lactamase n=1 Tax=Phytomonospora sp. NPDC050363 TaxID=3155642 RepID=UPI0033FAB637